MFVSNSLPKAKCTPHRPEVENGPGRRRGRPLRIGSRGSISPGRIVAQLSPNLTGNQTQYLIGDHVRNRFRSLLEIASAANGARPELIGTHSLRDFGTASLYVLGAGVPPFRCLAVGNHVHPYVIYGAIWSRWNPCAESCRERLE